jgi:hypothetical protein
VPHHHAHAWSSTPAAPILAWQAPLTPPHRVAPRQRPPVPLRLPSRGRRSRRAPRPAHHTTPRQWPPVPPRPSARRSRPPVDPVQLLPTHRDLVVDPVVRMACLLRPGVTPGPAPVSTSRALPVDCPIPAASCSIGATGHPSAEGCGTWKGTGKGLVSGCKAVAPTMSDKFG